MTIKRTSTLLQKAHDLLAPRSAWCKGTSRSKSGKAHCAIGGIEAFTHKWEFVPSNGSPWSEDHWEAIRIPSMEDAHDSAVLTLAEAIVELHPAAAIYVADATLTPLMAADTIVEFNDSDHGSKKRVLAAYKRAIEKAKQAERSAKSSNRKVNA